MNNLSGKLNLEKDESVPVKLKKVSDGILTSSEMSDNKHTSDKNDKESKLLDWNIKTEYSCHLCTYKSCFKHDITNHLRGHRYCVYQKAFTCDFCTFKSKSMLLLRRHMQMHLKDESEIFDLKSKSTKLKPKYDTNKIEEVHDSIDKYSDVATISFEKELKTPNAEMSYNEDNPSEHREIPDLNSIIDMGNPTIKIGNEMEITNVQNNEKNTNVLTIKNESDIEILPTGQIEMAITNNEEGVNVVIQNDIKIEDSNIENLENKNNTSLFLELSQSHEKNLQIKEELDIQFEDEIEIKEEISIKDEIDISSSKITPRVYTSNRKAGRKKGKSTDEYACDFCPFMCHTSFEIRKHVSNHKKIMASDAKKYVAINNGIKQYLCPKCPFRCPKQATLDHHMVIHKKDSVRYCPNCPFETQDANELNLHKIIHYQKCKQCKKTYSTNESLQKHIIRAHSKIKPLSCDVCGFSCTYKTDLIKHMKIHLVFHKVNTYSMENNLLLRNRQAKATLEFQNKRLGTGVKLVKHNASGTSEIFKDEDWAFFNSIMASVKQLTPYQKLKFRSSTLKCLIDINSVKLKKDDLKDITTKET